MKKLFTLLVLFTALSTVAQTVEEYKQEEAAFWKKALREIEPQITTGILYTKATPFSNLYNFNTTEYNTANASLFKQALSELYRSSDKIQFTSVKKLDNLKKSIYFDEKTNAIPLVSIGVLNTSFNFLFYDEENEDNGGLRLVDGIFKPIEGKPSVFTRHISLISPQKELITTTRKGTVRYKINPTIFFDKGKKIKRLTANFGTDSNYTLISDSIVNTDSHFVRYNTFGDKKLKFTIAYTDNSELITYADITLIKPKYLLRKTKSTNCTKTSLLSYTSTISYRAWDELSATSGKLNYKIFFGNNNQTGACNLSRIKKPFIVIDGFDPGDTRRIETEDCRRDPICKKLNADADGNFDATNYKSIVRLIKFGNGPSDNIVKKLQAKNYDVIIINLPTDRASWDHKKILHDFGADYIERNAMSFVSFIKEVNTKLTQNNSTEKLVVVGPSMGGQITRYALAYMEKKERETGSNSWNHNTRLWVSVDSPHQGANIPLAVQGSTYFLGFIHEDEGAKTKYKQKLLAPATKQMLINHYGYSSGKSTYFTRYQNGLIANGLPNTNGYPTKSRNIAIVNGSMSGRKTAHPGQRFLDMRGFTVAASFWFLVQHRWTINLFTIKNNYQQEYNQPGVVFNIRSYKVSSDFYNSREESRTNSNTQGSLDVVPGGLFNSGNDLKEEIVAALKKRGTRRRMYTPSTEIGTVVPHAFIPTHSALDTNGFSNWYQSININLVSANKTPFDTYYGESTNTEHVSFTQASKNWLFNELDGINQLPVPAPIDWDIRSQTRAKSSKALLSDDQDKVKTIESSQSNFSVYPNPSKSQFTVAYNFKRNSKYKIHIYNSLGKIVTVKNVNLEKPVINLHSLINGIYYLRLSNDNMEVETTKLLIKK